MYFNYKGQRIFAFSDTHGMHRNWRIPSDTDILICVVDAISNILEGDLKKYIINGFVSDDDNTNEGYPIISGLLFSKEPEKSEKSKITVSANEYGKVYPTGDIYLSLDGSISLNIIPDDGYEFVVTVDDVVNKGFDGTLFMPSAVKHNIYIEFRKPSALDDVYGSRFRVYKKNSNIYINTIFKRNGFYYSHFFFYIFSKFPANFFKINLHLSS